MKPCKGSSEYEVAYSILDEKVSDKTVTQLELDKEIRSKEIVGVRC